MDAVSSEDVDLLKVFRGGGGARADEEDDIHATILAYFDEDMPGAPAAAAGVAISPPLDRLTLAFEQLAATYPFSAPPAFVFTPVPAAKPPARGAPRHFRCRMLIDSCCGEELWLVVNELLRVSGTPGLADVSFRIVDGDGDFVLLHAAHYLPRWIDPAAAADRVFVRHGKIQFVHYGKGGRDAGEAKVAPSQVLKHLIGGEHIFEWSDGFHKSVDSRLAPVRLVRAAWVGEDEPSSLPELKPLHPAAQLLPHRVAVVLPKIAASLFSEFPHLISVALINLPPDTLPRSTRKFVCTEDAHEPECVLIRMTRGQLARLRMLPMKLPYQFAIRTWKRPAACQNSAADRGRVPGGSAVEAATAGARLCAGLESAAAHLRAEDHVLALFWGRSLAGMSHGARRAALGLPALGLPAAAAGRAQLPRPLGAALETVLAAPAAPTPPSTPPCVCGQGDSEHFLEVSENDVRQIFEEWTLEDRYAEIAERAVAGAGTIGAKSAANAASAAGSAAGGKGAFPAPEAPVAPAAAPADAPLDFDVDAWLRTEVPLAEVAAASRGAAPPAAAVATEKLEARLRAALPGHSEGFLQSFLTHYIEADEHASSDDEHTSSDGGPGSSDDEGGESAKELFGDTVRQLMNANPDFFASTLRGSCIAPPLAAEGSVSGERRRPGGPSPL